MMRGMPGGMQVDGRVEAGPAGREVLEARLEDGLIFRRQRRLLAEAGGLARIEAGRIAGLGAAPLALQVGIFRIIPGLRVCNRQTERQRERDEPE